MQNTELIIPSEIAEVVKSSSIQDLTKAEKIAVNYAPLMAEVQEQMQLVKQLEKGNKEHLEKAKRIRIDLGKIASRAEKQKKADKDLIIIEGRFIDALYNVVDKAARLTQSEAQEIEIYFIEQERKRIEAVEAQRRAMLEPFTDLTPQGLGTMDEQVFQHYLSGQKLAYEARIEAEKKAEFERIEAARIEAERIKAQRIENERLKAEAAKREAEIAAERKKQEAEIEKQRKIAEEARKEAEAKMEAERKAARIKAERLEAIRQQELKAEREKQAALEAELKAKREAEAAEQAAKEKARKEAEKLANAPIKQQLNTWVDSFSLGKPMTENDTTALIEQRFEQFRQWAKTQVENI